MEPEELTYEFLLEITDGFSEEREVGQGGFGTVYKGVTKTGVDVAVKKPRDGKNPDLDFNQFQNEFDNLTKVKHVNVVQFLGYCYEIKPTYIECGEERVPIQKIHRALCFEYLHNGSLQKHLSDESCRLDWHTRFGIIKGTCEGLRYIHEKKSLLHLDLKPDNILLDKDMVPKIADFGLSRIFGDQPIWASESSFGTLGYKPPEYINEKRISKKFDIFSLGVIIIRVVSRQQGYPKCLDMPSDEFIDQVQRNWKEKLQETCSGFLIEACCCQVKTCTRIVLDCLEEDSQKRPDIVKIIDKLKEIGSDNCKTYQAFGEHDTVFTMHDLVHDLAVSLLGDKILDQSIQDYTGGTNCWYALLADCSKPLELCMTSPATLSALLFVDCWTSELHGAAFDSAESLRVLDLSECSIQKLPDCIDRLKQLRYLNTPRVRDRMVPECNMKLLNLRYLGLRGSCAILALPGSIGEMEGLVHLDLSGCTSIEKLPESYGNLKRLEHLDFSDCINVTGVSECLVGLTKLQHLNLSTCRSIGDLPTALGSLSELQYLNLSDSSYLYRSKLGKAEFLGSLTKLKYLKLSKRNKWVMMRTDEVPSHDYNFKGELPETFVKLCNLVHLDLSFNSFDRYVLSALNGLTKLQYLDLQSSCDLFYVAMEGNPEVFGSLSELRHLNLGHCLNNIGGDKINSILDRICTLTNLEHLNISCAWDITSIPEALGNLRKLHTLDLSYCGRLLRLPASVSELDSLKSINTNGCSILNIFMDDISIVPQLKSSSNTALDFLVHLDDGESTICPFQLNYHKGCLDIDGPEKVKSAKEVQTINVVNKKIINELALTWTREMRRDLWTMQKF